jgi:hypothetical protein
LSGSSFAGHGYLSETPTEEGTVTDRQPAGLSDEELAQQEGEELPDREQMSLVNANVAIPINAAVAANVLSDNATAVADAAQSGTFTQTN